MGALKRFPNAVCRLINILLVLGRHVTFKGQGGDLDTFEH